MQKIKRILGLLQSPKLGRPNYRAQKCEDSSIAVPGLSLEFHDGL